MSLRTIMIFPQFSNIDVIDRIREKYDPLYGLVRPHITLVFPFEDNISSEDLQAKIEESLKGVPAFKLVLHGVSKQEDVYGNYLFLNVTEGVEELIHMHNSLYSDIWNKAEHSFEYMPHMTIGKLASAREMNEAFSCVENMKDTFETNVRKVSVEMIGESEESIIIFEKELHESK